ncbi:MAG: beta-propeller fold lactonase family protein [Terriglobales bacterium]
MDQSVSASHSRAAAKSCLPVLLIWMLLGCGGGSPSNGPISQPQPLPELLFSATQNGITVFPVNASTGALGTGSQATSAFTSAGFLANMVSDAAGKFLFAYSPGNSAIEAFSINAKTGALATIDGSMLPIQGFGAGNLSIDPTGKFLYAATSAGVSAFTVNSTTGVLSAVAGSPFSDGSSLDQSVIDPSDKFLYALSNTSPQNTISVFTINSSNGALNPIVGSPFQLPFGTTYSVALHPSGKFLYISYPQTEQIAAWSINASSGTLTIVSGSPFASGAVSGDAPNGLLIAPSGKFLYAWSGGATFFGFSVDANSGALSVVNGSPFTLNSATADFSIDPSSQFLYAAYANANTVAGFNIDVSTGALTAFTVPPVSAPGVSLLTVVKPSQ